MSSRAFREEARAYNIPGEAVRDRSELLRAITNKYLLPVECTGFACDIHVKDGERVVTPRMIFDQAVKEGKQRLQELEFQFAVDVGVAFNEWGYKSRIIDELELAKLLPEQPPAQPPKIVNFVGRGGELSYFREKLLNSHLAVIVGMTGVGKTALAATLAQQIVDPSKLFWHSFHEKEDINVIIWQLANFLAWNGRNELWLHLQSTQWAGDKGQLQEVLLDRLILMIREGNYLICFDDFQYVDDDPALSKFVKRMQEELRTGTLSLIITSQRLPDFISAREFEPLHGLTEPDTNILLETRGQSLSDDLMKKLYDSTKGNVQLLILAIDALTESADSRGLIAGLSESPNIARYLNQQVHKGLTDQEKTVMYALAVLQGYHGSRDAIEAIVAADDLWEILDGLVDRNRITLVEDETGKPYGQHAIVRNCSIIQGKPEIG